MSRSGWPRRLALAFALLSLVGLVAILIARSVGSRQLEQAKVEFESKVGPLELAALMRPELPRERNAAIWLLEGAELATATVPGEVTTAAVSPGRRFGALRRNRRRGALEVPVRGGGQSDPATLRVDGGVALGEDSCAVFGRESESLGATVGSVSVE